MKQRIRSQELLFFISYGLFITMTLLRTTFFYQYVDGAVFKAGLGFCVLITVIKEMFFGRGTRRMLTALLFGFGYIGLAVFVQITQYLVFAATVIFIFAARDIPFRRIAAFSAVLLSAVLCIVIICSQLGVIRDFILDDGGRRIRHYLGFRYALFPSTVIMNITMLVIYVRKKNISWLEVIVLLLVNYWIFRMTGSRLAFILSLAIVAIGCFLKLWPQFMVRKKKIKYCISMCFIVLALASLFVSIRYDSTSSFQRKINSTLSNRLKYQKKAMDEYGFSWFGDDFEMYGNGLNVEGELPYDPETVEYFYVDNNYISWYVRNGIIFFVLMLAVCTAMAIRSIRYDPYGYLLIILALMAVFCVIQDTFLSIHYNTFLLAAGNLLMNNKTEEVIEAESGFGTRYAFAGKRVLKTGLSLRPKRYNGIRWS